jgi:mannitol/fructose-specific phosphotransferase system IIA component (Ntr-type)/Kef-type K+ transport system membrane component KefB
MLGQISPLLSLAILLVAGLLFGNLAHRLHLPSVTGQILIGMLLGPSVLNVFPRETVHQFQPFTMFALGLIAATVGSHLNIHKLRNAYSRLGILLLLEATITPLMVFAATYFIGIPWHLALILGILAVSTAPATVVALIQETRSRGVFVKTLIAAVALNNIACIFLFQMAYTAAKAALGGSETVLDILIAPFWQLITSLVLGGGVALGLVLMTRRVVETARLTTISSIAIVLTIGLAETLGVCMLLSTLILGIAVVNLAPNKENLGHGVFANFQYAILSVFFILAGMELHLAYVIKGGLVAAVVVTVRIAGKWLAANLAMHMAKATTLLRRYLGLALVPQAGLAVGLILLLEGDKAFAPVYNLIMAVGLTSVIMNELIGPVLTRFALRRSGDYQRARVHLMDFLNEENITTDFNAASKEDAIEKLVDILLRSNRISYSREKLLQSVLEREAEMSTCLGEGLAIPHAELQIEGGHMIGAMGISRKGLEMETPDGKPVHMMVLLATPPNQRDRHLAVLAAMARTIGSDPNIQKQLFHARSPAHVCEILHSEEQALNYRWQDD